MFEQPKQAKVEERKLAVPAWCMFENSKPVAAANRAKAAWCADSDRKPDKRIQAKAGPAGAPLVELDAPAVSGARPALKRGAIQIPAAASPARTALATAFNLSPRPAMHRASAIATATAH
jgi:hypothetical protein